jgi:predicted restriction endonuclease
VIGYSSNFINGLRQNPYVVESYDDGRGTWVAFYNDFGPKCDVEATTKFIVSLIKNLPGFEDMICVDDTVRSRIILARLGQGSYRDALEVKWQNKCSVTGISIPELLRASHIKPWRVSTNEERLDCHNGLLLSARLDALFDKYLISFRDDGTILVNARIKSAIEGRSDFAGTIRNDRQQINEATRRYLAHHREEFERRERET